MLRYAVVILLLASACATFYQANYDFNANFESGNIEEAMKSLEQGKSRMKRKAAFLYYANAGVLHSMLGDLEMSNEAFEQAYIFGEDYRDNYFQIAASYLVNPKVVEYPGEDHEHILLLYYKALNYLKMNDMEGALVECRRLNNRLNELSDRYKSDTKYRRDAFIHNLMGMIYDASGDYNNAFIAYRNAYEIYRDDYAEMFGIGAPNQLKHDLLRAAYRTGFTEELAAYEQDFDIVYEHESLEHGEVLFLWHNGLGPIKDEWSINFTIVEGEAGFVTFDNADYGFSFPFPLEDLEDDEEGDLTDLKFFRVAFPKYVERRPRFYDARLESSRGMETLEVAEDINAVAFKVLEQRMVWEFSRSLLRAALKKAAEKSLEKEDEGLGFAVGVINALTEQADTRNWQTIPHSIHYARVPLQPGENTLTLSLGGDNQGPGESFYFAGQKGKTYFHSYQTLY